MFEDLTESNVFLYAAKCYDKPNAVMSEFEEDLNRILYIKRLITKYYSTGIIKEKLILNHIIILYNVFGIEAATRILFCKFEEKDFEVLKPFLLFLNYLPLVVRGIRGKDIHVNDINIDLNIVNLLKEIKRQK